MRIYKRVQIICWSIVFIVFIGLALWFLFGNHFISTNSFFSIENLSGPYYEEARYKVNITDINNLDIQWTAGELTVIPYDGNEIVLVEYAKRDLEEDEILVYETQGDTLIIKYVESKSRFLDPIPSKKLEVSIPFQLANNMNEFAINCVSAMFEGNDLSVNTSEIKNVSGKVSLSNVMANNLTVSTVSGGIKLSQIESEETSLKTVSGGFSLSDLTSSNLSITTTSGSADTENVKADAIALHSVSGDLKYDGSFKELSGKTTSGELMLFSTIRPDYFEIRTVSGDVDLTLPAFEGFNIQYKTVSGEFESEIPVTTHKDGDVPYIINTTSGDININKIK